MDETELEKVLDWVRTRISEGEYATADTFIEDVFGKSSRYDEDMGVRDAKIEQLTRERDGYAADLQAMKAKNYDLLMQIPAKEDDVNVGNDGDGEVIENAVDDGEVYHIDNLFVDDEEEEGR